MISQGDAEAADRMRITEGYLTQHFQGRSGGRDPALLGIAQDHALALLHEQGVFDLDVVLKGGTALRKCRAGNAGRFSTDLSTRGLRLPPTTEPVVQLPIHKRYDVVLPSLPVMALEEQIAEKLARYRRTSLARDLYDLAWCAERTFDEAPVRRIWVLKCFFDIVDDGLGDKPVTAADVLDDREESMFASEQIGYLTKPVHVPGWVRAVRTRFGFLGEMEADEMTWATANRGDRWQGLQAVEALT